ncbi:wD repeat domain [Chytriomyces hyalinus]|nr:wD repeat domain [Chytriomyces hyalinus]
MGQEQSATRIMRVVVDEQFAANCALPAPKRDSVAAINSTSASVHRANSSWSVLLNGLPVLALDGQHGTSSIFPITSAPIGLAETVDFECAPMYFRQTSIGQCIESMHFHSSTVDFELNVDTKENTIKIVCLTSTTPNASLLSPTPHATTVSSERRFKELEQAKAAATRIDAAIEHFENLQLYASSGSEILEKFNFDAITSSLRVISNVGEMIPFISCACKVLSMMTAYIDSLEETKNDMAQLKKHCRLLEEAINLKIKVFFEEDSRWIVDDETCLTCYKISLNKAVDALNSAIKQVDSHGKEGLLSKSMKRSKMNLKLEERKLDFALKSLTILDPFQLAFDMSQIEHCFQSADGKRFWKLSRFRDNVTISKFMNQLQLYCSPELSTQDQMPIIQAVDMNMDGYVHVKDFARVFNAETVGETVSLLLESKKTFDLRELRKLCNPTDYPADAVDLLRDYVSGTRDALVDALDNQIQRVDRHSVFVLHATAGFGKSVIVAKLSSSSNNSRRGPAVDIADSYSVESETSGLMYLVYFFRHDDREIRTFDQFLKTLVYQMCCQLRSKEFQSKVEAILKQSQEEPVSNSETAGGSTNDAAKNETLLEVVVGKLSSMDNVVILIDACDECAMESWQSLADFIKLLASNKDTDTPAHAMRVVMTIRNDETSKQPKFKDFMNLIRVNALEVGSKEKQMYDIHERNLEGILGRNKQRADVLGNRMAVQIFFESSIPHLSQRGCQILVEKSKGNMLWARLALNVIRDARLDADVTYIAHNLLKPDMGSLYLEFFKSGVKMRTNDPEDLKRLLSIIACAVKPLQLKDVREVWRFTSNGISDKSDEQFAQVLVYPLCRMMVRTNAQGFVFLGHKSLRDMVDSSLLSQFVDTSAGHESLALFCINTIIKGFETGSPDYIQLYASEHLLMHIVASDVALSVRTMLRVHRAIESLPYDVSGASAMSQAALKFPTKTLKSLAHTRVRVVDSSDLNCAKCCFVTLGELKYNMADISSPYESYDRVWDAAPGIAYACCQWWRHFSAVSDATGLLPDLARFCKENLLHWIETMLLLFWKSADKTIIIMERIAIILRKLEKYANSDSTAATSTMLLSDALNMLRSFREPLNFNPLQLYHSVLLWCPQESALYNAYYKDYREKHSIPLLTILEGQELMKNWKLKRKLDKPKVGRFWKTNEWKMTNIAISSKFIMMGYEANRVTNSCVQMWRIGVEDPFKCFKWGRNVTAVEISPDNRWIVVGTSDGSLIVQFLKEDKYWGLRPPWYNEPNIGIKSICIGCDEAGNPKLIAAASANNEVTLWDYANNFLAPKVLVGHKNDNQRGASIGKIESVRSLEFSKNGQFLVAGSENGTVTVWTADGNFYQKLATILTPFEHYLEEPIFATAEGVSVLTTYGTSHKFKLIPVQVSAVAVSTNGTKIAAGGTSEGAVNLWERRGQNFSMISSKIWHSGGVEKLEFTADSQFLLSAVKNSPIQAWNLQSMQIVFQLGLTVICKTFALFPDEKSVAIVTDANILILSLPTLKASPELGEGRGEKSCAIEESDIFENLAHIHPVDTTPPADVDSVDFRIEVPSFKSSAPPLPTVALVDPKPIEFTTAQAWIYDATKSEERKRRINSLKQYRRAIRNQQHQESFLPANTILEQENNEMMADSDAEGGSATSIKRGRHLVIQKPSSTRNGSFLDSESLVSPSPRSLTPQVSTERTKSTDVLEEIEVRMPYWRLTKNGEHFAAAGNGSLEVWDLKDKVHFDSKQLKDDRLRNKIKIAASDDGQFVICGCVRDRQYQRNEGANHAGNFEDNYQDPSNCVLVVFSLGSNSDVASVEFPHVCDAVEISGDGSTVAIISAGNVYVWAWADGSRPVHMAQFSNIIKIGVSESLVACATATGIIQVCSLDRTTGSHNAIELLETAEADEGYIASIWIKGSNQISITRKFRQRQFSQNAGDAEHWERNVDTWTLSSKSPVLALVYGWIFRGSAAICWVPSDTAASAIVESNTILFHPLNRLVALKFEPVKNT